MRSHHLGCIPLRLWLGVAALSSLVLPVVVGVQAQAPVIDLASDLDVIGVNESFDPANSPSWQIVAPMPTYRDDFAIATGDDGAIYAVGGRNFEKGVPLDTLEAFVPGGAGRRKIQCQPPAG